MKILKYLLFIVLILIIAGSIFIATKEGDFQLEATRNIPAPREMVFDQVNDFRSWKEWEPWKDQESPLIREFGEKTRGKGARYSWKSEEKVDGAMEIIDSKPFSAIDQEITLEAAFGTSTNSTYWRFEELRDSTKVTWGLKGSQSFMEKLSMSLGAGSVPDHMRPLLIKGLDNLEKTIRSKMDRYTITVDGILQYGGGYYMYTTTAARATQVYERSQKMIEDIKHYMQENSIEASGKPFVLFVEQNQNESNSIFSAGVFTPSKVITPRTSAILNGHLPNQKVLRTTLKGGYKNLEEAWEAAYNFIEENDLERNDRQKDFQVYLSGPETTPNPAEWTTQLYIPLH